MPQRIWVAFAVGVALSSGCGSGSPLEPTSPTPASAVSLRGSTVNAIDGQALAGVTIKVGSQSAVSDGNGTFQLENLPAGSQAAILSAPSVVERHTAVITPADSPVAETLIPADFDLKAFDQMFRAGGRLERWTSPPSLVIITTVMNYESAFGDGRDFHATSEQLTDTETNLLVAQLTDALALLTGNTFTAFASVQFEGESSGAVVSTVRAGKIVVGRYNGIFGLLNTIGFGRWATDENGQVTAGAVYLDRDFDKTSDQRRLLRTHELGHALGYNHVTTRTSIMNPAIGPEPTTFDRQGAAIAFHRLPGNQSPDNDPSLTSGRSTTGGIFTISPIKPAHIHVIP